MESNTPVYKYMTFLNKSIDYEQNIAQAREVMRKLHLRHLPVFKGEKLIGVLSDRDINLILRFSEIDPHKLKIKDVSTSEFNAVPPSTPLLEVINNMIEKQCCNTVIMEAGKVLGVFTETEAYKVLSSLLT